MIKRWLKYGVEFILVTIAFFAIVGLSTKYTPGLKLDKLLIGNEPSVWGSNVQRVPDFEEWLKQDDGRPKLLILGSSTVYRGVNPNILDEKLGINSFNVGSSSQRIQLSTYLLKKALAETKIDYVLFDIYPHFWKRRTEESVLDWIINNPHCYNYGGLVAAFPSRKAVINYGYYSVKRGMFNVLNIEENLGRGIVDNGEYQGKGFVCSPDDSWRNIKPGEKKFKQYPHFDAQLKEMDQLCKENGAKLILLMPPIIGYSPSNNFDFGIPMIDANKIDIDTSLFYDDHHLFCRGTQPYTDSIAVRLNEFIK